MESEVATMKFVSQTTDIPVPRVFAYNSALEENTVRLPYILMECIQGNMLFDLGGLNILSGEQKTKLRKSIASIQCKLANATLGRLGCPVLKSSGDVDVGPLPAQFGFQGPFDSMPDYFLAWARHNTSFQNLQQLNEPELIRATESFPRRLQLAIERLSPTQSTPRYPIMHPDILIHNILLDDSYEVVGVIDWEYAHTAPIEVFAARMNMYATFDPLLVTQDFDEEARRYLEDVTDAEAELSMIPQLSATFGSVLGDLSVCMRYYEEGIALSFDRILDRMEEPN